MKWLYLAALFFISKQSFTQSPVQWHFSVTKIKEGVYQWSGKALIDKPWHLYAQSTPKGGPFPTKITFNKNPLIALSEPVKESGKLISKREEVFSMDVKYFEEKVEFIQVFKLKKKAKTNIAGVIEFMVCNDVGCLPPAKQAFSVIVD